MSWSPVVELRQYALRPGARDTLISLFDAELVETQEDAGMKVIGQFRDLDEPDRFTWLRGFPDMVERERSLTAFYGGPVWRANSAAANATMIDSDDVLLLKPARPGSAFALGSRSQPSGFVEATILYLETAEQTGELVARFASEIAPAIADGGGTVLGFFVTESSPNTYPALPVREGEHVLVSFVGLREARGPSAHPAFETLGLTRPPQVLRLAPTSRSALHGQSPPCDATRKETR